jgi:hypothetical protein
LYLCDPYLYPITVNCIASSRNDADSFMSVPNRIYTGLMLIGVSENYRLHGPLTKGQGLPDLYRCFAALYITQPSTKHHISKDLNPLQHCCGSLGPHQHEISLINYMPPAVPCIKAVLDSHGSAT